MYIYTYIYIYECHLYTGTIVLQEAARADSNAPSARDRLAGAGKEARLLLCQLLGVLSLSVGEL